MANVILSPKSGGDWSSNELLGFKIHVDHLEWTAFFDTQELPAVNVSDTILNNQRRPTCEVSNPDSSFFEYLRRADHGEKSAVNDFGNFLLSMFAYADVDRLICQGMNLYFIMCGKRVSAKSDVLIMTSRSEILLVVQAEQRDTVDRVTAEAKLIAEAIAAFSQNTYHRKLSGLPPLDSQVIPGIAMDGPIPVFYRIRVTAQLLQCVERGEHPDFPTVVYRCIPPVPDPDQYMTTGLVPLANRRIVLQCFQAFIALVGRGL